MKRFGKRRSPVIVALLGALMAISGCTATLDELAQVPEPSARQAKADAIAAVAGLTGAVLPVAPFAIQSYARGMGDAVTIYIEGDGHAWLTPRRQSSDPTPLNPVALELAARDRAAAVAYLARPCQYVASLACAPRHWGNARFSEDVVAAMDRAVTVAKSRAGASRIHLVGFSGGGAVAILLAARRDDIASLRTVAGYLDHKRLNREARVDPLSGSLDPMAAAPSLRDLPQLHLSGRSDRVIPAWVAASFVEQQGEGSCAAAIVLDGVGHQAGWAQAWPDILARPLPCAVQ